jgi:predicted DNA binding protein
MFEWPREASGEDVAETIGVASPTFHQHLRKAERKVFDAVFSSVPGQTG